MPRSNLHRRATRAIASSSAAFCLLAATGCGVLPGFGGGGTQGAAPAPPASSATDPLAANGKTPRPPYGALQLADSAPEAQQLPEDVTKALRGAIEPWVFAWRAGLGTCRLDQFEKTGRWAIPLEGLEPYDGNAEGEDLRLTYLAVPSPAVTRVVDPFLDWTLVTDGEIVRARRDGRPGVALVDLGQHLRQRVLAPRRPGDRIEDALWIDDTRLVVLAEERTQPNPYRGAPVVYLLDLADGTVTRFQGPAGDFEACETARRTLDRRLQARFKDLVFG